MGKKVTIRTLVSMAGPDLVLTAGDEWEVDEAVAEARIALGLAEAIETPPDDDDELPDDHELELPVDAVNDEIRKIVSHGEQVVETAAVDPAAEETRPPRVKAPRRRGPRR